MSLFKITSLLLLSANVALAVNNGDQAPDFTLESADGKEVTLSDYSGKLIVLEWYNGQCPFVVNHYNKGNMQKLQKAAAEKDVVWLSINSTNKSHKDYKTLAQLKAEVQEQGINSTAVLSDPKGEVGKLYAAKTTPHLYLIDENMKIVYQGAIDNQASFDADPSEANNYILAAMNEALAGKPISNAQTKPYGCSVKY